MPTIRRLASTAARTTPAEGSLFLLSDDEDVGERRPRRDYSRPASTAAPEAAPEAAPDWIPEPEGAHLLVSSDDDDDDDDVEEVQMSPSTRDASSRGNLILPQPDTLASRSTRSQRNNTRRSHQATQTQQQPAVIDLTEEPDSPVRERRSHSQAQGGRNPRRTHSQRISPPTLARSDGTFMGRSSSFIDLTADSPPEERNFENPRARDARNVHLPRPPRIPRAPTSVDDLIELEFIGTATTAPRLPAFAIGLGRRIAGFAGFLNRGDYIPFPPGFPPPQLDHSRNAFAPRESPKPPMEPVPPTRPGFTRNTCADPEKEDENIVICPACNEELAYDPSETTSTPTGAKKRKRAAGEHHFWALKKCGHVYCADCFENRKPSKTNPGVGFRLPANHTSVNELRCAVDDCETKVIPKGEWVGIFL